jgi:hypothetical protein
MPDLSTYRVIRNSDSAVVNTILWDGASALSLTGYTLQLDATRPVITPPAPEAPYLPATPGTASAPAAPTDAEIAALRAAVTARRATVAAAIAASPSPAAAATEGGTLGTLAQSLARLELGDSGSVTAANAALPACLALMPTIADYQGLADPVGGTPSFSFPRSDWFHFSRPAMLYRMARKHGAGGTARLSAPNEAGITGLLWDFCHDLPFTYLDGPWIQVSNPATSWSSENHGIQMEFVAYAAAHLASLSGTYAGQVYGDGSTPAEQLTAWNTRLINRLRWMGRYGVLTEFGSSVYAKYTLAPIYALAEFAASAELRTAARTLLDLYWCAWSQETVGRNHGGARSRMYPDDTVVTDPTEALPWLYFGGAQTGTIASHEYSVLAAADYTPPDLAYDLMTDQAGRGRYAVLTRHPAADDLTAGDNLTAPGAIDVSPSAPASYRYAWVTPEFAMGSIAGPHVDVAGLLSTTAQNRWNAVVFGGDKSTARIVAAAIPRTGADTQAGTIAVQDRATMALAFQATPFSSNSLAHAVRLGDGLTWVEQDGTGRTGWVFVAGSTGYAAIRVAGGTYSWGAPVATPPVADPPRTTTLLPASNLPIVIQAAGNSDFSDFAAFQTAVLAQVSVAYASGIVTVSGGLFGAGRLVLDTSGWTTPTVDGTPINLAPAGAFRSPFITGEWGGNQVRVAKGRRRLTLDFTA